MQSNSLSIRLYNRLISNPTKFLYLPLILYWVMLFIATSIPVERLPYIFRSQDKLEHLIAYLILSGLLYLSLCVQKKIRIAFRKPLQISLLVIIIYAAIDEIHQLVIPGRYCDFFDWLADVFGGVMGIMIIKLFFGRLLKKSY